MHITLFALGKLLIGVSIFASTAFDQASTNCDVGSQFELAGRNLMQVQHTEAVRSNVAIPQSEAPLAAAHLFQAGVLARLGNSSVQHAPFPVFDQGLQLLEYGVENWKAVQEYGNVNTSNSMAQWEVTKPGTTANPAVFEEADVKPKHGVGISHMVAVILMTHPKMTTGFMIVSFLLITGFIFIDYFIEVPSPIDDVPVSSNTCFGEKVNKGADAYNFKPRVGPDGVPIAEQAAAHHAAAASHEGSREGSRKPKSKESRIAQSLAGVGGDGPDAVVPPRAQAGNATESMRRVHSKSKDSRIAQSLAGVGADDSVDDVPPHPQRGNTTEPMRTVPTQRVARIGGFDFIVEADEPTEGFPASRGSSEVAERSPAQRMQIAQHGAVVQHRDTPPLNRSRGDSGIGSGSGSKGNSGTGSWSLDTWSEPSSRASTKNMSTIRERLDPPPHSRGMPSATIGCGVPAQPPPHSRSRNRSPAMTVQPPPHSRSFLSDRPVAHAMQTIQPPPHSRSLYRRPDSELSSAEKEAQERVAAAQARMAELRRAVSESVEQGALTAHGGLPAQQREQQ